MTLAEAEGIVRRLRRHFFLALAARVLIIALVVVVFFGALVQDEVIAEADTLPYAIVFATFLWILLTAVSVRQIRTANQASVYISSGRLDLAERQLKSAIHQFSLYGMGKLLACHNLAVVAHGQKDYQVAAVLCDGVVALRGSISRSLGRLCRILLADCRLLLGDTGSARTAIGPLSLGNPTLSLSEELMLLPIVLRCQIAEGDFERAARESLPRKVWLAELLDAPKAALVHALLARACDRLGDAEAAGFLQRRAELYHDLEELAQEYEILQDSPSGAGTADNNTDSAP